MKIYRSWLFIPSNKSKMLNKIDILNPDVYVLDLEDSVPVNQKGQARENIKNKLEDLYLGKSSDIFVRINNLDTEYFYADLAETINPKITGYIIPKFEDFSKIESVINFISEIEIRAGIEIGKIKLVLTIESPAGVIRLPELKNISQRILALAIGWEDMAAGINIFTKITPEFLDFIRMTVLLYARANNLLAIDTIYKNFNDNKGLKLETMKAVNMGFDGKAAIHPNQINLINSCFTPTDKNINEMEIILKNKDRIVSEGVVSISGVMYDSPHLKWALKVNEYLNEIKRKG